MGKARPRRKRHRDSGHDEGVAWFVGAWEVLLGVFFHIVIEILRALWQLVCVMLSINQAASSETAVQKDGRQSQRKRSAARRRGPREE